MGSEEWFTSPFDMLEKIVENTITTATR